MDLIEDISYLRLIKNFSISLIFGIILPLIIFSYIDPSEVIFNRTKVLYNGIIYVIVYSIFGVFKKHTFIRFLIGIGYILIQLYFFTIGDNIFTFFLPHCAFGIICIDGKILGVHFALFFNYIWMIICILILKGLNLVRNLYKIPEKDDFITIKFGKKKKSN